MIYGFTGLVSVTDWPQPPPRPSPAHGHRASRWPANAWHRDHQSIERHPSEGSRRSSASSQTDSACTQPKPFSRTGFRDRAPASSGRAQASSRRTVGSSNRHGSSQSGHQFIQPGRSSIQLSCLFRRTRCAFRHRGVGPGWRAGPSPLIPPEPDGTPSARHRGEPPRPTSAPHPRTGPACARRCR